MTHIQTYGWETAWRENGAMSGTSGQSKRLEAIQIELTGEDAAKYDVWYCVHAQQFGWLGWAKSGEKAGSAGYARKLEAFQVNFVRKGESFKLTSDRTKCFYDKSKDGANPK